MQNTSRSAPHAGAGGQPPRGGAPSGAPPSNTAPGTSNPGDIQILRVGIDSLYLSYPGQIALERDTEIKALKELAKSKHPADPALAVYPLNGHHFEVASRGSSMFPYVLRDEAYSLSLKGFLGQSLPLAYCQIKSRHLLSEGVEAAVSELSTLVEHFAQPGTQEVPSVSRVDLYVDFVAPEPLAGISAGQWVSRAKTVNEYSIDRVCSGYTIGQGGDLSARLYDKTREIVSSNKPYWRDVWTQAGWYPEDTVWRLEFQFKRRVLAERNISTLEDVLTQAGALWRYATLSWLKLTIPSTTDDTQSRWPLHPVWSFLADVDWPGSSAASLVPRRLGRSPSNRYLFENGLGGVSSFMAIRGITDPAQAFREYHREAHDYHKEKGLFTGVDLEGYLQEKAAQKARIYNCEYPGVEPRRKDKLTAAKARKYRELKDGE